MVNEIELKRVNGSEQVSIDVEFNTGMDSEDLQVLMKNENRFLAKTLREEVLGSGHITIAACSNNIDSTLILEKDKAGKKYTYLTVFKTSLESSFPL